eukprot:749269-Hanusia_phi.AAC.2
MELEMMTDEDNDGVSVGGGDDDGLIVIIDPFMPPAPSHLLRKHLRIFLDLPLLSPSPPPDHLTLPSPPPPLAPPPHPTSPSPHSSHPAPGWPVMIFDSPMNQLWRFAA